MPMNSSWANDKENDWSTHYIIKLNAITYTCNVFALTSTSSVQLQWNIGLPLVAYALMMIIVMRRSTLIKYLQYVSFIFVLFVFQTVDGKYFASETTCWFQAVRAHFLFKVPFPRPGPPTPPIAMLFFGVLHLRNTFRCTPPRFSM